MIELHLHSGFANKKGEKKKQTMITKMTGSKEFSKEMNTL